jgi:hypothetical protein
MSGVLRYISHYDTRILAFLRNQEGKDIDIPRAFSDAMELASQLGFRYLWTDALCIDQDDPADKLIHIENMDRIYASTQLTIISSSRSAFKGIPGISRLSRPIDQVIYMCNWIS